MFNPLNINQSLWSCRYMRQEAKASLIRKIIIIKKNEECSWGSEKIIRGVNYTSLN